MKNFVHSDGCTVTTHYAKTDPNCISDYYDVTVDVFHAGKTYHTQYGDAYHDRGREKADGFVDAIKTFLGHKFVVLHVNIADREEY